MLDESKCDPIDEWYQDDWGDWIDEPGEEGELIAGLQYFYNKTGVQPYLWITGEEGGDYKSEGSLEELSESKYKELFGEDEGHVIIIFREYPNESSNYICTVTPGYDAETVVMDEEAREILFHTGDSQTCDVIIDRAALLAMNQAGKATGNQLLSDYAELKCVAANINIAIRACKANKSIDFLQHAFAECDSISVQKLMAATRNGLDSIYEYLEQTRYADAIDAIKESPAAFDRWCDIDQTAEIQRIHHFAAGSLRAGKGE